MEIVEALDSAHGGGVDDLPKEHGLLASNIEGRRNSRKGLTWCLRWKVQNTKTMPREVLAFYNGQTYFLGNAFLCARRFFGFNEQLCGFFVQNKCNVSTLAGGTKALL